MLIVTGMHRSGTSCIANLLSELGADFGKNNELIEGDKWNNEGYYENKRVVELNNRILLGGMINAQYWTKPAHKRSKLTTTLMHMAQIKYLFFQSRKRIQQRAEKKKAEMKEFSRMRLNQTIKDPRFSLTLGAWRTYGEISKALYCYRDPFEVAKSIQKRNHAPLMLCYCTWLHHVNEFFAQAHGLPIVVVNYNKLFSDGEEEMKRVYNFMEKKYNKQEAREILKKVLNQELKRQTRAQEALPKRVQSAYTRLENYHREYGKLKEFRE